MTRFSSVVREGGVSARRFAGLSLSLFLCSRLPGRRWRVSLAALAGASALVAGYLSGALGLGPVRSVRSVYAACGAQYNCSNDPNATAVLVVTHAVQIDEDELDPVEPDDGETFTITPTWSNTQFASPPTYCICSTDSTAVSATVTWSDSTGWAVSCTGCNAISGPVFGISICGLYGCGGATVTNAWGYKLIVNVDHTYTHCSGFDRYLTAVAFTTTSVDDGNVIDETHCEEEDAVSPTSQTWSATDSGPFECAFNCDQSGAQLLILYE